MDNSNSNSNSVLPILIDIKGQLGSLEGKLDGHIQARRKSDDRVDTLEDRVTKIEHGRAREAGALLVVASAISYFITWLVS